MYKNINLNWIFSSNKIYTINENKLSNKRNKSNMNFKKINPKNETMEDFFIKSNITLGRFKNKLNYNNYNIKVNNLRKNVFKIKSKKYFSKKLVLDELKVPNFNKINIKYKNSKKLINNKKIIFKLKNDNFLFEECNKPYLKIN